MAPVSSTFAVAAAAAAASFVNLATGSPTASSLPKPAWTLTPTQSLQRFRGLAPVSASTAWVAGTNSTILRTDDGGATWLSVFPSTSLNSSLSTTTKTKANEEAELLEFRDIAAWSSLHAIALSIGEGTASRIYTTVDGGATWTLSFANTDPAAFYDCLAFSETDPAHGMVMSDPVEGHFRLLETRDQGLTWNLVSAEQAGMPPAREGESGFAASGTCLETKAGRWYLASGGSAPSGRVFASADDGTTWDSSVAETPIPAANSSQGVFSVRFRDAAHGLVVGGDFQDPTRTSGTAGWSDDGGVTWNPAEQPPHGYRSGAAWVSGLCPSKGGAGGAAVAVGPTGSDLTLDGGRTWNGFDDGSFDAVECVGGRVCWASGEKGRVARLVL
ncbi:cytochrome p450 [Apiospora saccharicola]|uniref:Cytochrome p450 n=1 Tax=Apiospora saccharicola TaxID=335842 RepID=A0ABR1TGI2_9PEZI